MLILLLLAAVPAPPSHANAGVGARDALLFGDLATFHAQIHTLSEVPSPAGATDADLFRAAQTRALAATTVRDAANALGEIAVRCGECHTAERVRVARPKVVEAQGDGVRAEMARHDRAMGLVWAGLVRPSPADLRAGADAFARSFLSPQRGDLAPAAVALDDSVTHLAATLPDARSPAERADRFGALLTTCATCHQTRPGGLQLEPD